MSQQTRGKISDFGRRLTLLFRHLKGIGIVNTESDLAQLLSLQKQRWHHLKQQQTVRPSTAVRLATMLQQHVPDLTSNWLATGKPPIPVWAQSVEGLVGNLAAEEAESEFERDAWIAIARDGGPTQGGPSMYEAVESCPFTCHLELTISEALVLVHLLCNRPPSSRPYESRLLSEALKDIQTKALLELDRAYNEHFEPYAEDDLAAFYQEASDWADPGRRARSWALEMIAGIDALAARLDRSPGHADLKTSRSDDQSSSPSSSATPPPKTEPSP